MTIVPEHIQLESKPCPFGCPVNDIKVLSGKDNINKLPGKFDVVRCQECGLMRTNPRPTAESMSFYYPDEYPPYAVPKGQAEVSPWMLKAFSFGLDFLFPKRKTFTTILPDISPGRALEIGCASGSFMERLKLKGWRVDGLEFSQSAAEKARSLGFDVKGVSLEKAEDPEYQYDLIVGWMVLEHLHDPLGALKKIYEWSTQEAYLAISVPNSAALEFKVFKEDWYALQLPAHLYHFTPKTLEKLLLLSGWNIQRVFHQRVLNNLIASIGYRLCRYRMTKSIGKKFTKFPSHPELHRCFYPFAALLGYLGQTGRITIWATK